jgi:hypothetical protein
MAARKRFRRAFAGDYTRLNAPEGWCGYRRGSGKTAVDAYFCFEPGALESGPKPGRGQVNWLKEYRQFGVALNCPR